MVSDSDPGATPQFVASDSDPGATTAAPRSFVQPHVSLSMVNIFFVINLCTNVNKSFCMCCVIKVSLFVLSVHSSYGGGGILYLCNKLILICYCRPNRMRPEEFLQPLLVLQLRSGCRGS